MRQDALEPTHPWRALVILTALFLAVSLVAAPAADAARPFPTGGQATFAADCDVTTDAIQIPANGKRIFEVKAYLNGPFGNPRVYPGAATYSTGSTLNGTMTSPTIDSGVDASDVNEDATAMFRVDLLDRKGNGVYTGTASSPTVDGVGCTAGSLALVWNRA